MSTAITFWPLVSVGAVGHPSFECQAIGIAEVQRLRVMELDEEVGVHLALRQRGGRLPRRRLGPIRPGPREMVRRGQTHRADGRKRPGGISK